MIERLAMLASYGAEWVMWILILLSVISVGVIFERAFYFYKHRVEYSELEKDVRQAFAQGKGQLSSPTSMPSRVAQAGLAMKNADAAAEAMNSEKSRVRQDYEQFLTILGTLGNNAPFIGLFGTVIGVIQAFTALKQNPQGGIDVVGGTISEALVATAVGLFVAIPAVIAFNFFQKKTKTAVAKTDAVAHLILSLFHTNPPDVGAK